MASNVEIANRALQKLGQDRISALTDDTENARRINACFEELRDAELMAHAWVFSIKRTTIAEDASAPDWGRAHAYTLPADYLMLADQYVEENYVGRDWEIEGRKIYTDDTSPLYVRYIGQVTDPTDMSPLFREALACRIAFELCEQITGSTSMKESLKDDHKQAVNLARLRNAIIRRPIEAVEDDWINKRA